jgi:hypothetical protein
MNHKKMNDVTAVIPCFNDGAYIQEAVDSLLSQTVMPDRIIIVDDGSDLRTRSIIEKIDHPLINVIYQENQGVAAARNRAISKVKTSYVVTLDADDSFEPTFIEKALVAIKSKPEVVAVCCYYQKYKNNKPVLDVIKPLGGNVVNFLVKNNGQASALFKKSIWEKIGGYDVNFVNGYEDWEFWIAMLRDGNYMHIIPETLWRYRIKNSSRDQIALATYDFELKQQLYVKHKDLYLRHFEKVYSELTWRQKALNQSVINLKSSKQYKIGGIFISPIRFVKRLFK